MNEARLRKNIHGILKFNFIGLKNEQTSFLLNFRPTDNKRKLFCKKKSRFKFNKNE